MRTFAAILISVPALAYSTSAAHAQGQWTNGGGWTQCDGRAGAGPWAKNAADWVVAGPHIMVTTPNTASLNALPAAPTGGTPWVMWKGTPYAHIMVPVKG